MGKKQSVAIIKILIGNLLMGFAYAKWMKPNEIINGGVTSVAMILEKITGINILFLTNGVTILLLLICLLFLGKDNFIKSLLSSIFYNLFFSLFYSLPFTVQVNLPVDFLLASLFISIGYYCCLSSNSSTVGMDVLALVLYKKNPKINIAKTIRYINYIVLGFGLLAYGPVSVIVGLLFSFVYSYLLNQLMEANQKGILI
ncbi:YitT family protein [Vagococcus fluvialis]|uniref:YitT family protein n=1 Tax=Vagococcus fluvialis TaxID=2738 RepID=UPI001A8E9CBC|nr:YitT family protein [Vagococcus fluvialis]MBO0443125.1 YitT family protein [Vagococcus fluvialis]